MILRRVMDHVRTQNWLAVALDFVIVVLGVFIGIQVSNWNDIRVERALEENYLDRLREDFSISIVNAEGNIERMQRQYRLEGLMLEHLARCELDAGDKPYFDLGMYLVGRLEPPPLVRETIDELQSTGRLTVIRDVAIRQEMAEILSQQKINAEVLTYIVARMTPHIAYVDFRVVINQPEGGYAGMYETGLTPGIVEYDFEALCEDRQYHAAISSLREMTRVVIAHNEDRKRDYERMVAILDGALGRERAE